MYASSLQVEQIKRSNNLWTEGDLHSHKVRIPPSIVNLYVVIVLSKTSINYLHKWISLTLSFSLSLFLFVFLIIPFIIVITLLLCYIIFLSTYASSLPPFPPSPAPYCLDNQDSGN